MPRGFLGIAVLVVGAALLAGILSPQADAAPPGFVPITVDNAAQVQPLDSVFLDSWNGSQKKPFFSASGDWLVFSSGRQSKLLNLINGEETLVPEVMVLAISGDGSKIVSTRYDLDQTSLMDTATGATHLLMSQALDYARFSPDDTELLTGDYPTAQLWDAATGVLMNSFPSVSYPLAAFSSDSRYIFWWDDEEVHTLDLRTNQGHDVAPTNHNQVTFSPDGCLFLIYDNLHFALGDAISGDQLATGDLAPNSGLNGGQPLISPDNSTLIFYNANYGHTLRLWDIKDHSHIYLKTQIETDESQYYAVFSPDSTTLAIFETYENKQISLISLAAGELTQSLELQSIPTSLVFGASSTWFATTDLERQLQFWSWDGTNAEPTAALWGQGVIISPDDTTVVGWLSLSSTLIYGISSAERPARPFSIPAEIIPTYVNLHSAPSLDSEIVGRARGFVQIGAISEDGSFAYLPDQDGWVRADPVYLSPQYGIPFSLLPVTDSAADLFAAPTLEAIANP